MMVYVDDLLIASENYSILSKTKKDLASRFPITDLGELNHFLGIKFDRSASNKQMTLTITAYIDCIIDQFNVTSANSVRTPMIPEFASR